MALDEQHREVKVMASSAEVVQPASELQPATAPPLRPAWGGAGMAAAGPSLTPTSPWGKVSPAAPHEPPPKSFQELMSEDLAKDLQQKETQAYHLSLLNEKEDYSDLIKPQEDVSNDMYLAQVLQYEYDREYDQQVNREEKLFNGNSKVSVSFNKFKICPSWYGPDSDDEPHDIDDENRAIDSFEAREREDPVIPACGYVKHGEKLVTKHDLAISGRKNAVRIMNLPPGINTGDGGGFDMKLSNKVYNKLCHSARTDLRRKNRVHDKVEKATSEMALDPKTRLLIFKMLNNAVLEALNGIVSSGKEAVVFHAQGGELEDGPLPEDCAVKVFKTTLTDFKTRERYIREDYRFKDRLSKNNSQKLIRLWAEKEYHNLRRLHRAGIPSPKPVLIKKHILIMSFIGADCKPAPKLKDARLSMAELCVAYEQVVEAMVKMFHGCHLVHADLSEYNILWYEESCWIIDLGQAVEPTHPHALHFLHRDCTNIIRFFQSKKVPKLPSPLKLFEKVSGISLPGPEESAHRMIEEYETHQELWREGMNNIGDQFEFLWQEIQAEERQCKGMKKDEEDDEEEELEEQLMEDLVASHQREDDEDPGGECSGSVSGAACLGGGEPAGAGAEGPPQGVTTAATPARPDSKHSPTHEGGKGGAKWVEKQAKKKKSKNKKNK